MSQPRGVETRSGDPESPPGEAEAGKAASFAPASGIVRREDLEAELFGGAPPWAVVNAYLTRGEHCAWVEAHAARSRAFVDVLAALRNDQDERREALGVLLPFRRRERR
jgi:hypothetical protein